MSTPTATANQIFFVDLRLNKTDLAVPKENILYVELREGILQLVPIVTIKMNDKGNFTENYPICDGDVITLTIAPTKEADSISMEFIVSEFVTSPRTEGKSSVFTLTAYYNIPTLFTPDLVSAKKGSSFDVLSAVVKECGSKVSNDSTASPCDNMVWYRHGCVFEYMSYILSNSYVSDDTAFFYMDHTNKFRYNTYKSAAEKNAKFMAKFDIDKTQKLVLQDPEDKDMMYFKSFDVVSINGTVKNEVGYGVRCMSFNGEDDILDETITDSFKVTDLENVYTGLASPSSLRVLPWAQSNPDVYENFYKAKVHNQILKMNMYENTLTLMINPLTNVSLMDCINLQFPSFFESAQSLNDVWSGKYLITTIVHTITFGGTYEKTILVARRGLNKSSDREYNDVK